MVAIIRVEGVSTRYGTTRVLNDIHLEIEKGDFVGIVGPNGSGKTTLLNNLGRLVPYQAGTIHLHDRDLLQYRNKEAAQMMSAVTQNHPEDIEFRVWDVVMMGRTPHWHFFAKETESDRKIAAEAIQLAGIEHLKDRKVSELSGGERQRVFIAQAIAQEPSVMLLDEPTSHLDIRYQISIMDSLDRLNREQAVTIIAVLHDLNLAAQYCHKMIMLKDGMIIGAGTPQEVLRVDLIEDVYQCKVAVTEHPLTGTPYVVLYSRAQCSEKEFRSNSEARIHIIAGGGSGASLMETLSRNGYSLSAGVLNIGDSDWQKGQDLKIPLVDEMPFSAISLSKKEENLTLARKSDVVIVTPVPFGSGNFPNAEIIPQLAAEGIPIILMEAEQIKERDYMDGKAETLYQNLKQGQHVYTASETEILALLERLTESR